MNKNRPKKVKTQKHQKYLTIKLYFYRENDLKKIYIDYKIKNI